jgi:ectoine hydroxylase-related dioxygenase (phytanoyl-CoA dioxygenase family)
MTAPNIKAMGELEVGNEDLELPARLRSRLDDDGYLFLRGVLDRDSVMWLRDAVVKVLEERGYVEPGNPNAIWTGKSLSDFGTHPAELHDSGLWQAFVARPAVTALFRKILGEEPRFMPWGQYRFTPPSSAPEPDPVKGRHQDGFYNQGLEFYTCWVPLVEIDESLGGLAVVPRMNTDWIHDQDSPPSYPIPADAVPIDAWLREDYRPGDIVIFHHRTPHSGLPNGSADRIRLSIDFRVQPASWTAPYVGVITAVDPESISLACVDGEEVRIAIDDTTYLRSYAPVGARGEGRVPRAEIAQHLKLGDRMYASVSSGRAVTVAPARPVGAPH